MTAINSFNPIPMYNQARAYTAGGQGANSIGAQQGQPQISLVKSPEIDTFTKTQDQDPADKNDPAKKKERSTLAKIGIIAGSTWAGAAAGAIVGTMAGMAIGGPVGALIGYNVGLYGGMVAGAVISIAEMYGKEIIEGAKYVGKRVAEGAEYVAGKVCEAAKAVGGFFKKLFS